MKDLKLQTRTTEISLRFEKKIEPVTKLIEAVREVIRLKGEETTKAMQDLEKTTKSIEDVTKYVSH